MLRLARLGGRRWGSTGTPAVAPPPSGGGRGDAHVFSAGERALDRAASAEECTAAIAAVAAAAPKHGHVAFIRSAMGAQPRPEHGGGWR